MGGLLKILSIGDPSNEVQCLLQQGNRSHSSTPFFNLVAQTDLTGFEDALHEHEPDVLVFSLKSKEGFQSSLFQKLAEYRFQGGSTIWVEHAENKFDLHSVDWIEHIDFVLRAPIEPQAFFKALCDSYRYCFKESFSPRKRHPVVNLSSINTNQLKRLSNLSVANNMELTGLFISGANQRIHDIEEAIRTQNPQMLELAAHNLRGSARTFGAEKLAGLCNDLESCAYPNISSRAPNLMAQLVSEFRRIECSVSKS